MLRHIVMFKLKDRTAAHIQEVAARLRSMEGHIDELQAIEVGVNIVKSARAFDIALVTEFADQDALDRYIVHPVHKGISQYMSEQRETSAAVDYLF